MLQSTALEYIANAVVITDIKGDILWVNPSFTILTGYTSEEVIGKNPRLLKSGKHDQKYYKTLWETVLAGKTWRGSFTNRRKDGTLYYDEHTITPVRSKEGVITHFVAIMNDMTEQRRVQQALDEERDFISAVVDTIGSLVIVLDRERRIVRFNRACEQLTGYSFQEVKGRNAFDFLITPEEQPDVISAFARLSVGQLPNNFENHWVTKKGSLRLITWSNTAMLAADGAVEYVIGTGIDITERNAQRNNSSSKPPFSRLRSTRPTMEY